MKIMKIETSSLETVAIITGVVCFIFILFLIYHQIEREQLSLSRNEEGRLDLQE